MLTITEYNTLDRLKDLRSIWTELWRQSRNGSLFNSFDWFVDHCRHAANGPEGVQPHVLVVTLAGRPVGILPLVCCTVPTKLGAMRTLSAPQTQWRSSLEPVGPNAAITFLAAMKHLRDSRRDWDLLEFVVDTDAGRRRLMNAVHAIGMNVRELPSEARAVVRIDSNWREFRDTRTLQLQQRFLLAEQKLSVSGDVRLVRVRPKLFPNQPVDTQNDLFAAFLRGAHHNAFSVDDGDDFEAARSDFNHLHEQAVAAGCADISVLYVNNRPAAAAYCVHHAGSIEAIRIGWAADSTREAAIVLIGHLLREAFARGNVQFRFPASRVRLADGWETHVETGTHLQHFAPRKPRAQLLRLGRWIRGRQSSTPSAKAHVRRDLPHDHNAKPRLTIVG